MKDMLESLDYYIEFAAKTKRFSDVGFYKRVKQKLLDLESEIHYKQALIDELMFEHCPDEMTKEQIEEWEKNQVVSKNQILDLSTHEG